MLKKRDQDLYNILKMKILVFALLFLSSSCFGEGLINISQKEYYQKNPSPERKLMLDFIVNQFTAKTINQLEIDKLWQSEEIRKAQKLIRIQIVNQQLYFDSFKSDSYYSKILFSYFQKLIQKYRIKDLDLIILSRDNLNNVSLKNETKISNFNGFMMSKNLRSDLEKDKFLMPDAFIIEDYWRDLITRIKNAKENVSWKMKENKIFWRGASSGSINRKYYDGEGYNSQNIDNLPRLNLTLLSKLFPDLIDARFTYKINSKDLSTVINILFNDNYKRVKEEDHLKYKYLISIDGNTCPWLRVPWIMLSNSILLKQESNNMEWFYPAIKPYIHYVPVDERLTDLFSRLEWMKQNDMKLEQIVKNAHNFVENNLMPDDIDAQMVIILNKYSEIQTDTTIKITLPKA